MLQQLKILSVQELRFLRWQMLGGWLESTSADLPFVAKHKNQILISDPRLLAIACSEIISHRFWALLASLLILIQLRKKVACSLSQFVHALFITQQQHHREESSKILYSFYELMRFQRLGYKAALVFSQPKKQLKKAITLWDACYKYWGIFTKTNFS